jgi:hypothetical protein
VSETREPADGHGVTIAQIRAVTGAATPHFALQVRDRVRELIAPLPPGDAVREYGERRIAELEELARHSGEPRGVR